ncbi:required for drug-induced death protein 1 [Latimeria chalumnae]|uniref:Uncharacterized protein n=1 Tax=Latimeria chalumnae TaxID=7897 RepID=H3AZS4_LATCH|nr:PREDICTED: uncharacterized protein C1orf115 homolog [Latimeria chalumnae]|eukprot:XP_006002480.1 PREDICTED: uncharacterized protein C1orf115 homolog [Latimeria chalumnae]
MSSDRKVGAKSSESESPHATSEESEGKALDRGKLKKKKKKKEKPRMKREQQSSSLLLPSAAAEGSPTPEKSRAKKTPSAKEVHFAFLPDKYEPLVEGNDDQKERKEEKKYKRKLKRKKLRKNIGKVVRNGWRCLVLGLQELSAAYAAPWGAVSAVVTDVHVHMHR